MRDRFVISEVGLRLIKTYEGFRPVDMELVSGQSVAGYGHRVQDGQSMNLTKAQAEALLLEDLAPYEAMINDQVFAPLSQSQFDALCSLAFNIGPKKFLHSDTLRALNNGRVLDAASGFDVWRRANINGESYVVDALVRRRTAEKVLFLRPQNYGVLAPRAELTAVMDETMAGLSTAAEPVLEQSGLVGRVNYNETSHTELPWQDGAAQDEDAFIERRNPEAVATLQPTPMRRKDDHPGGVLTLSEVHYDDEFVEEIEDGFADVETEGVETEIENDDFEGCDIIEDIKGFVRDIEQGNDINTGDDSEDIEYDDAIIVETAAAGDSPLEAMQAEEYAFDPELDISSRAAALSANTPSPIASAAAEVSDRLDALMGDSDAAGPQMDGTQTDGKVLPFTPRKDIDAEGASESAQAPRESAAGSSPRFSGKPLYASLLEKDDEDAAGFDEGGDSASRYIEHNVDFSPRSASALPLSILAILGMSLLGGSLGAIASGFDSRFGAMGNLLSSIGVVMGIMITLGSVYYILKKSRKTA